MTAAEIVLEPYWRVDDVPALPPASEDEHVENLRALLQQAVRDRMRTRDRVGAHLSGGLDSSTVAVLASREARKR